MLVLVLKIQSIVLINMEPSSRRQIGSLNRKRLKQQVLWPPPLPPYIARSADSVVFFYIEGPGSLSPDTRATKHASRMMKTSSSDRSAALQRKVEDLERQLQEYKKTVRIFAYSPIVLFP